MKKHLFLHFSFMGLMGLSTIAYGDSVWTKYGPNFKSGDPIPNGDCLEMICEYGCVENKVTLDGDCCPIPTEGTNCLSDEYNEKGCLIKKKITCPSDKPVCNSKGECISCPKQTNCRIGKDNIGDNECPIREATYCSTGHCRDDGSCGKCNSGQYPSKYLIDAEWYTFCCPIGTKWDGAKCTACNTGEECCTNGRWAAEIGKCLELCPEKAQVSLEFNTASCARYCTSCINTANILKYKRCKWIANGVNKGMYTLSDTPCSTGVQQQPRSCINITTIYNRVNNTNMPNAFYRCTTNRGNIGSGMTDTSGRFTIYATNNRGVILPNNNVNSYASFTCTVCPYRL